MRLIRRDQRGDTLIEVLVAIAVVSLVLTAAYVITNKNTLAIQANQERLQAQHLVESQIESLRSLSQAGTLPTSANFCFPAGTNTPTDGTCTVSGVAGSGADYTLVIVTPGSSLPGGTPCMAPSASAYTVCAYWDSIDGQNANDSDVTMFYRVNG